MCADTDEWRPEMALEKRKKKKIHCPSTSILYKSAYKQFRRTSQGRLKNKNAAAQQKKNLKSQWRTNWYMKFRLGTLFRISAKGQRWCLTKKNISKTFLEVIVQVQLRYKVPGQITFQNFSKLAPVEIPLPRVLRVINVHLEK